jgi:hypothetical protein
MSLLSGLTIDNSIQTETDVLGGGGPLESGLYKATVTLAYLQKSKGGALGLVTHFKSDQGREFRETLWITSGDAKGNKNYYEKDGEKKYLPGFLMADALCLLTVGRGIAAMDTEQKVVNVYSYDAKAEVPTKVDMLVDLLGQEILVGLLKQTVDKNVKNDAGAYVPSGESREENVIEKLFRARDNMTTAEIRAQVPEATFYKSWEEKWAGKTRDRTTKGAVAPARTGAPMAGAAAGAPAAGRPTNSLFG